MSVEPENDCSKTALALARKGIHVFPVRGKHPLKGTSGFYDATTDGDQIRAWWAENPNCGVAIRTGTTSGLWVLDVDGEEGLDALTALELEHGDIPETIGCKTRRGLHLYFRMNSQSIPNSTSKVAPGLDVRGDGGYVIAPPSPHPDGGFYTWHPSPKDAGLCDAPPWLLERVAAPEKGLHTDVKVPAGGRFPKRTRNSSLTSLAGSMRRPGMSADAIYAALSEENRHRCDPPLPDDEVRVIAESVSRYDPGPETTGLTSDDLTDTGNAERLVQLHGEELHHIAPWRKWIGWVKKEGRWVLDHGDVHVRELAKDVGRRLKKLANQEQDDDKAKKIFGFGIQSLNTSRISGMVDLARGVDGIPLKHEALDANGWILGVQNGVIDLETGRIRNPDPADLMTLQAPVDFDPGSPAPRWEQALLEWFPDPETKAFVKRVAGSALVGAQRDHIFVIHYGHGRNGKGSFVRALQRVLGPYCTVIHLGLLIEQRFGQHDTVKADLFRTRLAIASETQRRVKLDEASVKNLTGGDRITARRMREDPWEFDPTHSLWLQTNNLPEIGGRDRGIWSRIRVVKWESTFEDQDQDQTLDETLATEAPGILRWLVEGCLEWQEHGLREPEAVIRETLAYRNAEDILSRFAEDVGLVFQDGLEIQAGELQELLTEWAQGEGIDAPSQDIGDWIREQGAHQTRRYFTHPSGKRKRARFWVGVGLDDGNHEAAQVELAS